MQASVWILKYQFLKYLGWIIVGVEGSFQFYLPAIRSLCCGNTAAYAASVVQCILHELLGIPWSHDGSAHVLSRSRILTWFLQSSRDIIHSTGIYRRKESGFDRASLEHTPRRDVLMSSTSCLFPFSSHFNSYQTVRETSEAINIWIYMDWCEKRDGKIWKTQLH